MNKMIPVLLFIILCFSCSLDYSQAIVADQMQESIPETVLLGFERIIVQNGIIQSRLKADKAENFSEQAKMTMEKVEFIEYNSKEKITTEGKADSAILYTDTENVEIYGNIHFYSTEEESAIEAETLFWDKENEILTSNEDELVKIIKKDGSYMQGRGFQSDFSLKEIKFSNGGDILYIHDEEDDDKDQ